MYPSGFEIYYIPNLREINPILSPKGSMLDFKHPIYRATTYIPSTTILGLSPLFKTEEDLREEAEKVITQFIKAKANVSV